MKNKYFVVFALFFTIFFYSGANFVSPASAETMSQDVASSTEVKEANDVSASPASLAVTAKDSNGVIMNVYLNVFRKGEVGGQPVTDGWTGSGQEIFFPLSPGIYDLQISDEASGQETLILNVTLKPGEKIVKEVSFDIAWLAVMARNSKGEAISVYVDVFRQNEENDIHGDWTGIKEPRYFNLPPGVYDLKVSDEQAVHSTELKNIILEPGSKVVKKVTF